MTASDATWTTGPLLVRTAIQASALAELAVWIEATMRELHVASRSLGTTWEWRLELEGDGDSQVLASLRAVAEDLGGLVADEVGAAAADANPGAKSNAPVLSLEPHALPPARSIVELFSAWEGSPLAAREVPGDGSPPKACVLSQAVGAGQTAGAASASVDASRPAGWVGTMSGPAGSVEPVTQPTWVAAHHDVPNGVTIVMRTQGTRMGPLHDAMLSLEAQFDRSFDVVVVAHNAPQVTKAAVCAGLPDWLVDRVVVVYASGGTRSLPLNVGIEHAHGDLVVFLDDDDLALPGLTRDVLAAGRACPGLVIRSQVAVQRVRSVEGEAVALEPPQTPYPTTYSLADHLRVNMTPFMGLAFPRRALQDIGGADVSLLVCEDWDLGLRAVTRAGVVDSPALIAIYRRWTDGGDSYTTNSQLEWDAAMAYVRAKMEASFLLLSPGAAGQLIELSRFAADPPRPPSGLRWWLTWPYAAVLRRARRLRVRG